MTPFSATLRSEWTKLISLRSTKVMLACSLLLAVALSALLANVVGHTWASGGPPNGARGSRSGRRWWAAWRARSCSSCSASEPSPPSTAQE
jgi:hypothetical protein